MAEIINNIPGLSTELLGDENSNIEITSAGDNVCAIFDLNCVNDDATCIIFDFVCKN